MSGVISGKRRWRTMPWIVVMFGLAIGPLGFMSVLLVVLQPVMFDTWCTLSQIFGFISIVIIVPTTGEKLASLQYLKRVKTSGLSLWKEFWGYKSVTKKVN